MRIFCADVIIKCFSRTGVDNNEGERLINEQLVSYSDVVMHVIKCFTLKLLRNMVYTAPWMLLHRNIHSLVTGDKGSTGYKFKIKIWWNKTISKGTDYDSLQIRFY